MRFDVYRLPMAARGFVVDVQADLLSNLATRMVIPLLPEADHRAQFADLHPIFEIHGERHILVTHELASLQKRQMQKPVASLVEKRDQITRALDILLTGF